MLSTLTFETDYGTPDGVTVKVFSCTTTPTTVRGDDAAPLITLSKRLLIENNEDSVHITQRTSRSIVHLVSRCTMCWQTRMAHYYPS
jgi:hypothetical protein